MALELAPHDIRVNAILPGYPAPEHTAASPMSRYSSF